MASNDIRKIKKRINGENIYIEVCDEENGFTTVNPKCYSYLNGVGRKFSVKESILLLLGVDPEIPLKMTLLMKELFLFEKELSYKLKLNIESFQFVPYRYGPYSRKLEDTLHSMDGLIVISNGNKKEVTLTDDGKKEAQNLLDSLSPSTIEKLKFKRLGWDQWGNRGILKRVYTDYPIYIVKSEIKDEVLGE